MENYDDNFKKRILKEISEVKNIALVARKNNIPKSTLQTWVSNTKRDIPEERDRTIKSNKIKELEKKLSARELKIGKFKLLSKLCIGNAL
ncbi:MAG: transposase [Psychroserpens sp.]|nr:transposase [Psychroserpens sp.]